MIQAVDIPPSLTGGRPAFYMNRVMRTFFRRQIRKLDNVHLTFETVGGKKITSFDEVPIKRNDVILNTEERVVTQ
jgi:hypothetical protein